MGITILIFFLLYALDQASKLATELFLKSGEMVTLIPHVLDVTKVYNTGAAWSLFEEHTWILVLISACATVILAILASKNDWRHAKLQGFSITMALAGCVGNFFDRLLSIIPQTASTRPGVVDMISFKPFDWLCNALHLGTTVFNVADTYLVIGLIIYAIDLIFFQERRSLKYAEAQNI